MDAARFKRLPIMGILRGIEADTIGPLIETIVSSGLETVEITMNTENAASMLRSAKRSSKGALMIGAGTVLNAV